MSTKLDEILEHLEFSELELEQQQELLGDINDMVLQGTLVRLVERMDDATRDEFATLMEKDVNIEELEGFLEKRVPGADRAVEESLAEVADDILAVTQK